MLETLLKHAETCSAIVSRWELALNFETFVPLKIVIILYSKIFSFSSLFLSMAVPM
jgi:hypothetical protein